MSAILSGWQAIVASKDDGSYHIAVPAGKGHLLFFGPTPDFVLKQIGSNQIYAGRPGGNRIYAHDFMAYEAKIGNEPSPEISATLQPGLTIKGRVEGPEGQTVTSGILITTLRIEPFNPTWRGDFHLPIKDGRFEAHGLAPEGSARLHFLDAEHQWGASVEVTGKQASDDPTIRLEPCGQAKARFITPAGQPVVNLKPHIEFVATPGASEFNRGKQARDELFADSGYLANVQRKHYWNGPATGADGRIDFPALIPGAFTVSSTTRPSTTRTKACRTAGISRSNPARRSTSAIS